MSGGARDSVGLSAGQRQHNVAGRIEAVGVARPRGDARVTRSADFTVLLIDDVVTTGATLAESVRVLTELEVPVSGALVVASA